MFCVGLPLMIYEIKRRGPRAFLKVITVFVKFKWNHFEGLLTVHSPESKLFASCAIFALALRHRRLTFFDVILNH